MIASGITNHAARVLFASLTAAALSVGTITPLRAQQEGVQRLLIAPLREGFHFALGIGAASVSASCDDCEIDFFEDRLTGLSGFVQVGAALSANLVIAGEFLGWLSNDPPIYRRIAALSLVVLGYPSATSGLFIKGGLGGMHTVAEDGFLRLTTDAWSAQTGVGFDFPVGDAMVTPFLNYVRTFGGETEFSGLVSAATALPAAIQFGLALTVH